MRRKDFLKRLEHLELSQKKFSEITGCSYQTVKQWKDNKIPGWVPLLLNYIEILQSTKKFDLKGIV